MDSSSVLISIVIPVYNGEKYLDRCLVSLMKQSNTDFELVLINDGSVDGSDKIISLYLNNFSNCNYIKQANFGSNTAYKNGIIAASGKYIVLMDQDTWLPNYAIEVYLDLINDNPNADIIHGQSIPVFFDTEEKLGKSWGDITTSIYKGRSEIVKAAKNSNISWPTTSYKAIKKSLLANISFVGDPCGSDTRAFLQIMPLLNEVVTTSKVLHYSLYHQDSLSHKIKPSNYNIEFMKAMDSMIDFIIPHINSCCFPCFELHLVPDLLFNSIKEYSLIKKRDYDFELLLKKIYNIRKMWITKKKISHLLWYHLACIHPLFASKIIKVIA